MEQTAAIKLALSLIRRPATARQLSHAPLPGGLTELLSVAAGNAEALQTVGARTEQTSETLRAAAAFFIEQIMFAENADSYRILGAMPGAPRSELRRHMVLLMSWLHPDTHEQQAGWDGVDRSVFIHRVIRAWADLKSDVRRSEYDRMLDEQLPRRLPSGPRRQEIPAVFASPARATVGDTPHARDAQRFPRLIMFRLQHAFLSGRLLSFLRERQ